MNLQRKIEIVQQDIRNISQADDADTSLRSAALDRIDAFVVAERAGMTARVAEKIKAQVGEAVQAD